MVIIHDARLPGEYVGRMKELIPEAVPLSFDMSVTGRPYDTVINHPDIYFCDLGRVVVCSPDVPEKYTDVFAEAGIAVVRGEREAGAGYPDTARYNAVAVGRVFMHNLNLTDRKLLHEAEKAGYELVHVKQGYARCAVVIAGENAIVTADKGIASAAKKNGLEVLEITDAEISLPGETRGFLGGASGYLPGEAVLFLGDITRHPDFSRMAAFLGEHSTGWYSMEGLKLYDAGSLIISCGRI
jgi:hypothetical protein